jgi:hypothetical protein
MGMQQILFPVYLAILVVWHFLSTRDPTSTIPEELCRQRGAGWERETGERVEAVGLLVKDQFKVKGVETFMGLAMTWEGPTHWHINQLWASVGLVWLSSWWVVFMTWRRVSERDNICKGILGGFLVGKNKSFSVWGMWVWRTFWRASS